MPLKAKQVPTGQIAPDLEALGRRFGIALDLLVESWHR